METAIKLCQFVTFLLVLLLTPILATAHETGAENLDGSAGERSLQERMRSLEERQVEIYHSLEEKKAAGLGSEIGGRLSLSGLIEVEAAAEWAELADGHAISTSDLKLATVQLGVGAELTEQIRSHIVLLHEEGGPDLEVDEASIDLDLTPVSGRIGRIYLPFGVYSSHFITSPLTQELGEIRESAVLLGYGNDLWSVSGFFFNGAAEKIGVEDQLRDWGGSFVMMPTAGLEVGGSYLSDLADSDAELLMEYRRRVAGWSAFASYEFGAFGVNAEVLGAVESFATADLDENGDGAGDRPLAWNVELFWALDSVELAARCEGSKDFAGQPRQQYGLVISWSPWENAALSVEYLHGSFKSGFDRDEDGNNLDQRNLVTAQWALAF